jgi:hypothetical protein
MSHGLFGELFGPKMTSWWWIFAFESRNVVVIQTESFFEVTTRVSFVHHFHCSPIVISAVTKPDDYLDRDYFPIQTSFLLKVLRCTELLFARASLESCLLSIMLSLFMDFVNGTFFITRVGRVEVLRHAPFEISNETFLMISSERECRPI